MAVMDNGFRTAVRCCDGQVTLAAMGEIDLATAPELEVRLKECLARRPDRLVLDFARVTFCDCTGVDVLERARRKAREAGIDLKITGVKAPIVVRVFEVLGLSDLLEPDQG
ncbi:MULTISPECIES: STAS domain-containing protein [Kitasatospora]|uniref:Anti-sigma factor antagonist n=1 Tax=Kitasatospora cathayae TaxID=3004092 RepID=A0ABY7PVF9_9ACTN|nr:STAS domain-containing protein [Kitasatospora sp. HUAS 3-15]WBP84405.1 STAS domain-containing protein [Kitasatospora sp. HUAS 3-15]